MSEIVCGLKRLLHMGNYTVHGYCTKLREYRIMHGQTDYHPYLFVNINNKFPSHKGVEKCNALENPSRLSSVRAVVATKYPQ